MPSPFPGMDPYLEHPGIFGNLHQDFIVLLKAQLQHAVPQEYFVRSRARSWIDGPHEGWREGYAELCTKQMGTKRVVAIIQVLTPANKGQSQKGRELYLQQQLELLRCDVHLVEVDLLRGGTHTTAVPLGRFKESASTFVGKGASNFDYHVSIHHFDRRDEFFVVPFGLRNTLPVIGIPLLPEDGNVALDLQAVFNRCYDVGPYRYEVDYLTNEVLPPLSREDAQWAQEVIEAALRTSSGEGERR